MNFRELEPIVLFANIHFFYTCDFHCIDQHIFWERACNSSFKIWLKRLQSGISNDMIPSKLYSCFDAYAFHILSFKNFFVSQPGKVTSVYRISLTSCVSFSKNNVCEASQPFRQPFRQL